MASGVRPELYGMLEPESREDRSRAREHKGAALEIVAHHQVHEGDPHRNLLDQVPPVVHYNDLATRSAIFESVIAELGTDIGDWLSPRMMSMAVQSHAEEALEFHDRRDRGSDRRRPVTDPRSAAPYEPGDEVPDLSRYLTF
jgi:hypothetical protein